MLKAGDVVDNPVTGQRVIIGKTEQETQGAYVEVEYIHLPFAGRNYSPRHFHPTWTERFEILSGSARYQLGSSEGAAQAGETLVYAAGLLHIHPWNTGATELRVRQTTIPPRPDPEGLHMTLAAIEALMRLAQAGKVNRNGLPNPLQLAVLLHSMQPNTYVAGLPGGVQRPLLGLLAGMGQAAGYRPVYPWESLRAAY